jgi:hypothetical protein
MYVYMYAYHSSHTLRNSRARYPAFNFSPKTDLMWTPESDPNILFEFRCEFTDIFEFVSCCSGSDIPQKFYSDRCQIPSKFIQGGIIPCCPEHDPAESYFFTNAFQNLEIANCILNNCKQCSKFSSNF